MRARPSSKRGSVCWLMSMLSPWRCAGGGSGIGMRRFVRAAAWVVCGALLLAACGPPERPARDEWERSWQDIQEVVPSPGQLERPVSRETCEDVLAKLREHGQDLTPAPDEVIQAGAQAWLSHAEHLFFECFNPDRPDESIKDGYEQLQQLQAEVDAALAVR